MTPLIPDNSRLDDGFQKAIKAMPVSTRASNPTGFHNFNIDVTDVHDEVEKPNDLSEILPQDSSQINDNSFLLTINDAFKYHNASSSGDVSGLHNRKQRCKYTRTRLIDLSRIVIIWLRPPNYGFLLP